MWAVRGLITVVCLQVYLEVVLGLAGVRTQVALEPPLLGVDSHVELEALSLVADEVTLWTSMINGIL